LYVWRRRRLGPPPAHRPERHHELLPVLGDEVEDAADAEALRDLILED